MLLDLKWPWKFLQKGNNPHFIVNVDNKITKDSKIALSKTTQINSLFQ